MAVVPSGSCPNAFEALRAAIDKADAISVAVAFVTRTGVDLLAELLDGGAGPSLDVVARGAPITEPDALVRLHEELGATVSVVMGPEALKYHPKLWLVHAPAGLTVLSGSGNLTRGGLIDNHEQFELFRVAHGSAEADDQEWRFARLTSHAIPLAEARASAAWLEWESQARDRRRIEDERRRLDKKLASRFDRARPLETDARALLSSLVGKPLLTIGRAQPNSITALRESEVIVATNRSPAGWPVPVERVQAALDELHRKGRVRIDVPSVGHRSAFIGAVLREMAGTTIDGQWIVLSEQPPT